MARITVQEFQRAVLHQAGAAAVVLGPGRHRYRRYRSMLGLVDLRPSLLKVAGQEVLTADAVGVRVTAVVRFAVVDPLLWVLSGDGPGSGHGRIYLAAQLAIRDVVAQRTAEELLAARAEASRQLVEKVRESGAEIGAVVESADVRNIAFPGELRRVFAQVAIARQESAAALERARGEAATLRSLANAARVVEGNPALRELRALLAVERTGGTLVLSSGDAAAHAAQQ